MQAGLPRPAKPNEPVSIDSEFFGQVEGKLHRPSGTFACLSIAYSKEEVYQVYDVADMRRSLERVDKGLWVIQNALYDLRQMRKFGDIEQRPVWDTMLMDQDLWGGYYQSFALDDLSRRWIGKRMDKSPRERFGTATTMTEPMKKYAATDAIRTLEVMRAQKSYIVENELEMRHYWEVDEPALWAFLDLQPVKIDVDGWLKLAEQNEVEGRRIEKELGINVNSPKDVGPIVERLSSGKLKRTKKGGVSTDAKEVLEPLLDTLLRQGRNNEAREVETILAARGLRKAASTYGRRWIETHVEQGDLVYADWGVTVAETGRGACRNPNLQNIPVRKMPVFRSLFITQYPRGTMHIADQNQQEPRIMAWWSKDDNLKEALLSGRDLHQETADDFGLTRREGKDINLGLGYGMSPEGLSSRARISLEAAEDGIRRRNGRYPYAALWMGNQRMKGASMEYVHTSMGRRIWLNVYGKQWERNAINGPIQGSAAEQTKVWLVLLHRECKTLGLPFRICLLVHDEIVADCSPRESRRYPKLLRECGVEAGRIVVPGMPMEVEMASGPHWGVKD